MPLIASVLPILPGQTEAWKQFLHEMSGPRKAEHAASRRRIGTKQETAFLQHTPMGDVAVVITDGDKGPTEALQAIAKSKDPFDVWFCEKMKAIHGLDLSQ